MTYRDVTARAGIHFQHTNGGTGHRYYVETTGAGCAFVDYDNDGWLDVFAVQSGPIPRVGHGSPKNVLYRNNRDGTFEDVTEAAGLAGDCGYGQGVAVADYNNDGFPDLLVTSWGKVTLFRNKGNGTFEDVTDAAGLRPTTSGPVWSTSAAWGDYNSDGLLDLFICHYVKWTPETDQTCPRPDGSGRGTCPPEVYDSTACALYRNNGDGTFTDVSRESGIANVPCKALGVVWIDYDQDGFEDLLVTNDGIANVLFHNQRDGTFRNVALEAGVAYGGSGDTYNGMGIAVADVRHTGREDLVITNFAGQPKTVLYSAGHGTFLNATYPSHIGATSHLRLGFGDAFLDYDLDGWADLVVANGHVSDLAPLYTNGLTYAEAAQLFHNDGNGTFTEDPASAGDLAIPRVGRGLAVGDFNNDGAPDILISSSVGPLQLFQNVGGSANHWVTLRLEGTSCNRDAIGAKVWLTAGAMAQYAEVRSGSSYCSHSSQLLSFGLGSAERITGLVVHWPGGHRTRFGAAPADRFYLVREDGKFLPEPRLYRGETVGSA